MTKCCEILIAGWHFLVKFRCFTPEFGVNSSTENLSPLVFARWHPLSFEWRAIARKYGKDFAWEWCGRGNAP